MHVTFHDLARRGARSGRCGCVRFRCGFGHALLGPASTLGVERRLLRPLEAGDAVGFLTQETLVIGQRERLLPHFERVAAMRERLAHLEQLFRTHREEADLIEEAEEPGFTRGKLPSFLEAVIDLQRAPDELIAAGTLHAVDAEVRAAD